MESLVLTNLVNIYVIKEYLPRHPKLIAQLEMLQYLHLLFLFLRSISYGMINTKHYMANYGLIQIGYLYKMMVNQCTHLPLVNGL